MAQPTYYEEQNLPLFSDGEHRLLHKIAGSLYSGIAINNGIGTPIPVQQADLNAAIDDVSIFEGASSLRVYQASSTLIYLGEAAVGSAEGAAVWRIRKIDLNNPISVKWAGTGIYDQIWTNYAGLTYT